MKRFAALLLCLALLMGAANPGRPARALAAGVITFADPHLEAAVREAVGKPDGELTPDDVAGVRYLSASYRDVYSLSGIEQLTNLEILDLAGNRVSDLRPLQSLASLVSLYLSGNPVASLAPLSGLTRLENLSLHGTQVTDVRPLAGLKDLGSLNLSSTRVRDLAPLAGLTNLNTLGLYNTPITSLLPLQQMSTLYNLDIGRSSVVDIAPLRALPQLGRLSMHDTAVRDLTPLASLTALWDLNLGGNQITDLSPLSGLTGLQSLSITRNQVESLAPLAGMTDLRMLFASENRIAETGPLGQMGALELLDLTKNKVSDLSGLAGMTNLRDVRLGENQITDISPVAGLTNLASFEAPHNQITEMGALAGKPSLTGIDLAYNRVGSVPPLPGTSGLSYLRLSYNQVGDLSGLTDLPALRKLFLDWNQVTDIAPLAGHADLEYLQLFGNQVNDISPLAGSPQLSFLQAGRNQIRDISVVAGLTTLQSLGLYGNQITDISPLANLSALTWLHLGDNQISDITALADKSYARMETMDLSGNRISDAGALVHLRPVQELNLARNRLVEIAQLSSAEWVESGARIDLRENYIDVNTAADHSALDALRRKGARVYELPQRQAATNVVAVVIDNSPQAGPPAGISQAPVVYEVAVAPGITRLLALFELGASVDKIGPVRSSRDALVQLAAGHQGAFAHAGGSYSALKLAPKMPVTKVDEIFGSGDAFYREDAQEAPHNLYTSTDLLQEAVNTSDRPALRPATWFPVGPMTGGIPAEEATAHFTAARQKTSFVWDGTAYERQVGGTTAVDANGTAITVQNVVTLYASHQTIYRKDVGEWEVQAALVGSGTAQFYRDGLTWTGRWSRASASSPLSLTAGGKPYQFAEGNSWIMVADEKADQDGYISGKVTVTGRPDAGGVLVEALDAGGAQVAGMLTDATGAFRLRVPAGTYTVRATLAGSDYAAAPRTGLQVGPGKTVATSFTLAPAYGSIKGTVTDKVTGKAPSWGGVHLLDKQKQQVDFRISTDGLFSFDRVPTGSYTVKVTDEYYKDASTAVQVVGGKTQAVKVTVTPVVGSVSGKVVDTGRPAQPVVEAQVALVNSKGETVSTTMTDSTGDFSFYPPVTEGTYRLVATHVNYKTATLANVRVTGGKATSVTMTMQYSYGTVSVRVTENR
ncbi:MAG TPA: leucine-rich repeat domain-containing protein, partial [Symbiobacteriaceae bacterium]|nr:leucine-rich repeat domain-containing protein [Symbiobacteriaceae bacterium]